MGERLLLFFDNTDYWSSEYRKKEINQVYNSFKFVMSTTSIGTGWPFIVAKIKVVRSPIFIFSRDLHFRLNFFLHSGKGGSTEPKPPWLQVCNI